MKTTVQFCDFQDAFVAKDRQNTFTYEGKKALFKNLEELELNTGEEIELDIIALCCEFTEYENLAELRVDYNDIDSMETLEKNTTVIYIDDPPEYDDGENYDGRFIIQDY